MSDAVNHEPGRLPELEAVADSLPSALLIIDRQGLVVLANTLLSKLLNTSPDEHLEGRQVWQALPDGLREIVAAMQREVLIYGTEAFREFDLSLGNAVHRLLDVKLSPITGCNGQPEHFALSISEASARQEIAELKKLDQIKSNFLAMISHELRTPLTSIRGAVHLLADSGHTAQDPDKTLVGIIQSNSERLIRLVNNMLEMVAIDNDNFVVTPVPASVGPIISQAIGRSKAAATVKFLELEYAGKEGIAVVDPERFGQLTSHLLDNAVKFTPHGGRVTISTEIKQDGTLDLIVSDTGSGVPAHAREKVFDRFFQVEDPMTRCCGGAGVGLYLAKHIVQSHNGRMWVESNSSGGSDFHATFPSVTQPVAAVPTRY